MAALTEQGRQVLADPIQFREYKILLRAERFPEEESFHEFWKIVRHTVRDQGLETVKSEHPRDIFMREVLFLDTPNFDLYNNHFILRKRTFFHHGWLEKEHRLALKFRHPDRETAASADVRPSLSCNYKIQFKEELLLERDHLGGMRSIFSHGCVLESPEVPLETTFAHMADAFPGLRNLPIAPDTPIGVVNNLAIEEVFEKPGQIVFTDKLIGEATVAIWRNRATEAPMVGEFAFQLHFDRLENLHHRPRMLSEAIYKNLQLEARDWVYSGNTKTALVYRSGQAAVKNDE